MRLVMPREVADAVAVRVGEAARVDLVDGGLAPPVRVAREHDGCLVLRVSVVESVIPFRVPFRVDASGGCLVPGGCLGPHDTPIAGTRHPSPGSVLRDDAQVAHLIEPRVTPEITQRCEKMYTISSGAIAIRYDAKATV